MDSRVKYVRRLYGLFFARGIPQTQFRFEKPYKGGPTPLRANISRDKFQKLAAISVLLLMISTIEFVAITVGERATELEKMEQNLPNDFVCYKYSNISFLVIVISMGLNFVIFTALERVQHATDERWSQYMITLAINVGFQMVAATVAGALMIEDQLTNYAQCSELLQFLYIR